MERTEALSSSYHLYKERVGSIHAELDAITGHHDLVRVRPERVLCDTFLPVCCVAQLSNDPLYFDDNHLNSIGAAILSEEIISGLRAAGW